MSECLDAETDHIQIQRVLASEALMIYKVHVERTEEDRMPKFVNPENHGRFRCASSSVDAAAVISVVAPSTQVQSGIPALESTSGKVVADAPPTVASRLRKALGDLITRHPNIMSNVSTTLIILGGIAFLPGFANCVAGTMLAHPVVTLLEG